MKLWLFTAFLLSSVTAAAQEGGLTYRDSDPFLFCRYGQRDPLKCWSPVAPYTGQWVTSVWCEPVDPEGKPWSQDDWASLYQYEAICPVAKQSGEWDNSGGQADMVPHMH
jgi:hypothetical protein